MEGASGLEGVKEGVEGTGGEGGVVLGESVEGGFVLRLDQHVGAAGGVFEPEEDAEFGAGVGAEVVGEELHHAVVESGAGAGAGEVALGLAGVGVGDEPGEPGGHRVLPSRW